MQILQFPARRRIFKPIILVLCLGLAALGCLSCSSKEPEKSETQEKTLPIAWLEVSVTYSDGSFLPSEAILTLTLEDVSKVDAPSVLIGETTIGVEGAPPFPVSIGYDPKLVQEGRSYTLRAVIRHYDRLLYTSTQAMNPFEKDAVRPAKVWVTRVPRTKESQ